MEEQLEWSLGAVREVLGDDVVGAYLHGSALLTLARIWSTAATDVIRSKDAAADWALARLPDEQRPVLARARANYLDEEDERWDDLAESVSSFADHVVGEIGRVVRERRTPGDISLG
jgi:hypothetical protein